MSETNVTEVVAVGNRHRRLLLVGVSTRAAAESAARAGFAVTAVDAFGDLDQHPSVHARSLRRDFGVPFSAHAAARVARAIDCEAVAYLSSFENHPSAVRILSKGRALWGNTPAVLRKVRDPILLMETLRRRGFAAPEVMVGRAGRAGGSACGPREDSESSSAAARASGGGVPASSDKSWLVKPFQSGGGHGVRRWRDGGASTSERRDVRVPRHCYLQEFVPGRVGSVVFVAAGGRAVPLGVTCQLVGDRTFGTADYRYCGNILVTAGDHQFGGDEMLVELSAIAQAIAEDFQLIGVNGIDFVDRDGVPYAIEVNPRWSASMELVERVYGLSVFGLHAAACADRVLPDFDLAEARRRAPAFGKAIVFSRRNIVIGDTSAWLADDDGREPAGMGATIRDVPHPGEQISAGSPVCTVFAAGRDAAACYDALVERAALVYADLAMPKARASIPGPGPSVS